MENRYKPIKEIAHGRWEFLMQHFGLGEFLAYKNKEGPCPLCQGKTRFRFTDRHGNGDYYCNGCNAGTGVTLLQKHLNLEFKDVVREIHAALGTNPTVAHAPLAPNTAVKPLVDPAQAEKARLKLLQTWAEGVAIRKGDVADRYYLRRGIALADYPSVLRLHPGLEYWHEEDEQERSSGKCTTKVKSLGKFPTILALIQDVKGRALNIHRTYLTPAGEKANVPCVKKMMTPVRPMAGGAIQLFKPGSCMAIAEGIETALAVHHLTNGWAVWATASAPLMKSVKLPDYIETVRIFADFDEVDVNHPGNLTGQKAAESLGLSLMAAGKNVKIILPESLTEDFNDIWLKKGRLRAAA